MYVAAKRFGWCRKKKFFYVNPTDTRENLGELLVLHLRGIWYRWVLG